MLTGPSRFIVVAFLLIYTTCLWSSSAKAAAPIPLGRLDLGGPGYITAIRASSNGKRVIVILYRTSGRSELDVIDTSDPAVPRLAGSLGIDSNAHGFIQLALSPDGRRALLSHTLDKVPNRAVITLIDLTDDKEPKLLWNKEIDAKGTLVALAADASAYAITATAAHPRNGSSAKVYDVSGDKPSLHYVASVGGRLTLSADGRFLTAYDAFTLTLTDFHTSPPTSSVEDIYGAFLRDNPDEAALGHFSSKYGCELPRDDGTVLVSGPDARTLTILKANSGTLSPAVTMTWHWVDISGLCSVSTPSLTSDDRDLFLRHTDLILRIDLQPSRKPVLDGYWKVRGSSFSAIAGSLLFDEERVDEKPPTVLQVSRLDWADRSAVDWGRLNAVVESTHCPTITSAAAATPDVRATAIADALEVAGIFNAIGDAVIGVSKRQAARILRCYSDTIGSESSLRDEIARSALQRSMELDPTGTRSPGLSNEPSPEDAFR